MKNTLRKTLLALALVLALTLSVVALAEAAEPTEPAAGSAEAETSDSTALDDALDAYYAAKDSSRADNLEAELNEYVAAGKLTQEQADLILDAYKERQSLRDGVCPNCGYEFQTNGGYGRAGKGGRGGMHGRGGKGGMRGMYGAAQSYAAGDGALDSGMPEDAGRVNFL